MTQENQKKEHKVLFEVTYKYLTSLDKPEEAINEDVWNKWKTNIFHMISEDEVLKETLYRPLNEVAPRLGIFWKTEKEEPIIFLQEKSLYEIKNRKHVGEWWARSIVLSVASLIDMDSEKYELLIKREPSQKEIEQKELIKLYKSDIRPSINNYLLKMRKEVTNDNFEELFRNFIRIVLTKIFETRQFQTKEPEKYFQIFIHYFYANKTLNEIAEYMEMKQNNIASIMSKFKKVFEDIYHEEKHKKVLFKRWSHFADQLFETLDDSDLHKRNERYWKIKKFENSFVKRFTDDEVEDQ